MSSKSISTESDDVAWIWNWFAEIYFLANKSLLQQQPIKYPQSLFIPNSRKGLGIDSMGELAVSFELSGQFVNEAGISVPYIHIAHALEQAFNFTFGNVHKSKGRVFKRKPFNLTKALDYLKISSSGKIETGLQTKMKKMIYNSLIYRCLQNGFRGVHRDSPILFASFFRPLLRQCIGHK